VLACGQRDQLFIVDCQTDSHSVMSTMDTYCGLFGREFRPVGSFCQARRVRMVDKILRDRMEFYRKIKTPTR
jgi:hypothetical protein